MSDNRQNRKLSELEKVSALPAGALIPVLLPEAIEPDPEKRNKMLEGLPGLKLIVGSLVHTWTEDATTNNVPIPGLRSTDELTAFVIADPNSAAVTTAVYWSANTSRITLSDPGTADETRVFILAARPI